MINTEQPKVVTLNSEQGEKLKKAVEESQRISKSLVAWAEKQGRGIIQQLELKRAKETLVFDWISVKKGWLGGFVSGVQTGFKLGYKTANNVSSQMIDHSGAALEGMEAEVIKERNAELKRFISEAIGEASMCWSETPQGIFDSARAESVVDKIYERFATPAPLSREAQAELVGQERFPEI